MTCVSIPTATSVRGINTMDKKGESIMEAIVTTSVCMTKLEHRAVMSMKDCNPRDLCMATYG